MVGAEAGRWGERGGAGTGGAGGRRWQEGTKRGGGKREARRSKKKAEKKAGQGERGGGGWETQGMGRNTREVGVRGEVGVDDEAPEVW